MRRVLRIVSTALITAGIVILVDVGMTLAWKEPLSTVYGSIQQGKAEGSLDELAERFAARRDVIAVSDGGAGSAGPVADDAEPSRAELRRLAALFGEEAETGEGIGRIEIPAIGVEEVMVEGTDTGTLQKGPGRYPDTAFPGQGKTIGVAGHRTTYLAPFRKINEIGEGDEITLEMPYGSFTYEFEKSEIVDPYQVDVVDDVGYERVVLTACHPLYSAAQRYVVYARLVDSQSGA